MNTEASQPRIPETDPLLIEAELARLLAEKKFAGAPQMSAFLRYIVNQCLQGNADRIKAYSVGVDALGKPDSFDAQNDPSVRVLALRLRKTLSSIYESGNPAYAIVSLRVGTYVPDFFKAPTVLRDPAHKNNPEVVQTHGMSSVTESLVEESCEQAENARQRNDVILPFAGDERHGQVSTSDPAAPAVCKTESPVVEGTDVSAPAPQTRRYLGKILMAGVLVLAGGLWQFGDIRTVGAMLSSDATLASMVSSEKAGLSAAESQIERLPLMYYFSDTEQRNTRSLMSLLLGSRLVQSGSVKVMNTPAANTADIDTDRSYQLIVGQFMIEGQTRLEVQIVNMQTGEVLQSSTLNFSQDNGEFSPQEIASVESLAMEISSMDGPVYQDYCNSSQARENSVCQLER